MLEITVMSTYHPASLSGVGMRAAQHVIHQQGTQRWSGGITIKNSGDAGGVEDESVIAAM